MEVLASGEGAYVQPDPDGFREWVRTHKTRALVNKLMTEEEAISRFLNDGDYLSTDNNPNSLIREIIRQRKRDLWIATKYGGPTFLIAAGCVSRIDVGFMGTAPYLTRAVEEGRVRATEWSNGAMTMRHLAGAMGLPFIPIRYMGGTDSFVNSGAKLVTDPFTGQPICLLPAINPDVAMVHVHEADVYGNARIYGPNISSLETAMSAKRTIVSAEEIIDEQEIRRNPQRTTIPHFAVDAVVHAPFGSWPYFCLGRYALDYENLMEQGIAAFDAEKMEDYLDKYIYSVASDREMLEQVGAERLQQLRELETVREGYC